MHKDDVVSIDVEVTYGHLCEILEAVKTRLGENDLDAGHLVVVMALAHARDMAHGALDSALKIRKR